MRSAVRQVVARVTSTKNGACGRWPITKSGEARPSETRCTAQDRAPHPARTPARAYNELITASMPKKRRVTMMRWTRFGSEQLTTEGWRMAVEIVVENISKYFKDREPQVFLSRQYKSQPALPIRGA
jgi:hypothetical protein